MITPAEQCRRLLGRGACFALALAGSWWPCPVPGEAEHFWPHWRGPLGTGVAPDADPPVRWSEEENVRWKLALPGEGHSTPVVWGDRLFLTAATPYGEPVAPRPDTAPGAHDNRLVDRHHGFQVLAVDREKGAVAWQKTVRRALPHEGGHFTGSLASASPVTDGSLLFASFGSRGLYGMTLDGELLWEKDFGEMQTRHAHGEGSSPVLHGKTLVVNWDHEGDSFLVALDKRTGSERWRVSRDEKTSWSSPLVVMHQGKPQVIVSATRRVCGYDLDTGDLIWSCAGLSRNVVATPVAAEGMVFVSNSYDWQVLLGIRLEGARGDIIGTDRVAWSLRRNTSYVPSPLLYHGILYVIGHNQGLLTGIEAGTGEMVHETFRLPGIHHVFASPGAAAGRIYVSDQDGTTLVLKTGKALSVLARNQLKDRFSASPVFVGRTLYLRGHRHLYALAEKP